MDEETHSVLRVRYRSGLARTDLLSPTAGHNGRPGRNTSSGNILKGRYSILSYLDKPIPGRV